MNRKRPTRYAIRQEFDATWTVYDIFTGVPYGDNGLIAVAMPLEFAERLAFLLNLEYRLRLRL